MSDETQTARPLSYAEKCTLVSNLRRAAFDLEHRPGSPEAALVADVIAITGNWLLATKRERYEAWARGERVPGFYAVTPHPIGEPIPSPNHDCAGNGCLPASDSSSVRP